MDIRQRESMCRQGHLTIRQIEFDQDEVKRHEYAMTLLKELNKKQDIMDKREEALYCLMKDVKKRKKTLRKMKEEIENLRFKLGKWGY